MPNPPGKARNSSGSTFTREWLGDAEVPAGAIQFRAVSFNLLADGLAHGTPAGTQLPAPPARSDWKAPLVPSGIAFVTTAQSASEQPKSFRCPEPHLAWHRRWPKLQEEILSHGADVLGLQELDFTGDQNHADAILHVLEGEGYAFAVAKKKGRACDGVAILWRRERLEAVGQPQIWKLSSNVHVAIAQKLRLDGGPEFLAVATHLKAGESVAAETERLSQAEGLLCEIRRRLLPTLVLADLNSNCRPLYGWKGETLPPRVYEHLRAAGFKSAYHAVAGEEPAFTCWGGWQGFDVAGVFDYVLCLGQRLQPVRVLSLPPAEE
ncbi:unnamed protein product, partial [Polarella glacialis]